MVSTWSSGSPLQPTTYRSMFSNVSEEELTFIDFLPDCQKSRGVFSKPVYENFRSLVDRANDWLRANPQWEIITCESVEFKDKGTVINSELMVYLEYGEISTWYIRGLRLWIRGRKSDEERSQQLGYMNMIPLELEAGGIFSTPTYEKLDDLINRCNLTIRNQPIPGRIITIESQEMKSSSKGIEPDRSSWVERGKTANHFLYIIRIFFEITEANSEEIGIKDFTPDIIKNGGIFSMPKYEMFSNVINKASNWFSRQTDVRICNAQSLEIKINRGKELDTQKMSYIEHGGRATFYVRILRLAYTKHLSYSNLYPSLSSPITQLTCKTFVPVQLSYGLFVPEFETLQETKARISAWMKATGAHVLSIETTAMRVYTGGEAKYGTEASFTYNRAERNEYWLYVIRAYMNGVYPEPPQGMLPPVPEPEHSNCSIL